MRRSSARSRCAARRGGAGCCSRRRVRRRVRGGACAARAECERPTPLLACGAAYCVQRVTGCAGCCVAAAAPFTHRQPRQPALRGANAARDASVPRQRARRRGAPPSPPLSLHLSPSPPLPPSTPAARWRTPCARRTCWSSTAAAAAPRRGATRTAAASSRPSRRRQRWLSSLPCALASWRARTSARWRRSTRTAAAPPRAETSACSSGAQFAGETTGVVACAAFVRVCGR